MNESLDDQRLSRISTQWTVLREAQLSEFTLAQTARAKLAQRYLPVAYRYLLAIVKAPDLAEELCQELAVKFLESGFQNATPDRGRFRNYLKTTIVNLVRNYYREQGKSPRQLLGDDANRISPEQDDEEEHVFRREWQSEVLDLTWAALKKHNQKYHRILRLRVEEPHLSSAEIANLYKQQFDESITAANVRKIQERAHTKFADLLVIEVANSLEDPSVESVREELVELDLLKYCKSAFERWVEKQE
jgi:RNA polymerase sigma factor (sigma-70 family)